MLQWLLRIRARRRQHLLDKLDGEGESTREEEPRGYAGGFEGSGRRTAYDEGHTQDQWSEP